MSYIHKLRILYTSNIFSLGLEAGFQMSVQNIF